MTGFYIKYNTGLKKIYGVPYHKETDSLIWRTNQWSGFNIIVTSVMKELMIVYLNSFVLAKLTILHGQKCI